MEKNLDILLCIIFTTVQQYITLKLIRRIKHTECSRTNSAKFKKTILNIKLGKKFLVNESFISIFSFYQSFCNFLFT